MANLTIVYWRDIPAQVIVKAGRKTAKRELPIQFAEAIDMCAMKTGASETDDYLSYWRRSDPVEVGNDLEFEADEAVKNLLNQFPKEKLVALVNAGGNET